MILPGWRSSSGEQIAMASSSNGREASPSSAVTALVPARSAQAEATIHKPVYAGVHDQADSLPRLARRNRVHIDAKRVSPLKWRGEIWPEEEALVVTLDKRARRLDAVQWDLPTCAFIAGDAQKHCGTVFSLDLASTSSALVAPSFRAA